MDGIWRTYQHVGPPFAYGDLGLCGCQMRNGMKWIYDYMDHMMLNVDAIISLASVMYTLSWNYYELHTMDEKNLQQHSHWRV